MNVNIRCNRDHSLRSGGFNERRDWGASSKRIVGTGRKRSPINSFLFNSDMKKNWRGVDRYLGPLNPLAKWNSVGRVTALLDLDVVLRAYDAADVVDQFFYGNQCSEDSVGCV